MFSQKIWNFHDLYETCELKSLKKIKKKFHSFSMAENGATKVEDLEVV